jgi:O-antigen ligase
LPKLGVVLVVALAATALLTREQRTRAGAMLAALFLAPTLLVADIWHSPQLRIVHRHPLLAVAIAVIAFGIVALVAVGIARRPALFAPLAIVALPFRIPIQAGGTTSNLLVPLYLVVAAGALAFIVPALRAPEGPATRDRAGPVVREDAPVADKPAPGWTERLLALAIVLYGLQATYSPDFEKALQQVVFFYVPFALLFCLLRRMEWTPRLVRTCLQLVAGLAVLFALVGFAEYATKTIILNPKLVVANDLHTYFTVNSVFFDPDIFGRFLALVMIALAAVLLYARERWEQLGSTAVLAVLWAGLVLTLSRSSLGALLVGLAMLAALRWNASRTLIVAAVVLAIGGVAIAASPKTFGLNQGLNGASSGRADLVSGGASLFGDRPLWGYGSGSFVKEYRAHHPGTSQTLAASHTIPITIAAEQGVIGELAYLALVVVACVGLTRGARADPVRGAIAAAFVALVFHTLLYADFLEDPVTWTLLGVGVALARAARTADEGDLAGAGAGRAAVAPA